MLEAELDDIVGSLGDCNIHRLANRSRVFWMDELEEAGLRPADHAGLQAEDVLELANSTTRHS
jgi:hypothetical protein